MKWTTKLMVALVTVLLVALAANAIAQTPTPERTPSEPREEGKSDEHRGFRERRLAHRDECGPENPGPKVRRVVHSETKFRLEDEGFGLRTLDVGEVTAVNGNRITIKRADGKVVSATAGEDTRVCLDGERAQLSDVDEGDHAALHQASRNDEKTLKGVRAFSANE